MEAKKAYRCRNIFTATGEPLIDGYLVTHGNKIAAVGTQEETGHLLTSDVEIIDCLDHFLMPGIHDYHVHLMGGAMMERDGDLRLADSEEEAARMVWEKCKDGKREWILANAWDHFRWPDQKLPTRKSLDAYFPDTPVFLLNKESHGAWVNSILLELFQITKDTPDPKDGVYYRDEDGTPTGYLHEAAMFPILEHIYRSLSDSEIRNSVKVFQAKANRYGITSVGDVSMFGITYEKGYQELEQQGELTLRIHYSMDLFAPLDAIRQARTEYAGPLVRFNGVKGFIDGTPMGHTGYMLEPYTDQPDFRSSPMIEPEEFLPLVETLDREGIRIRMHACGDAGVRLCLDAFEQARTKNGAADLRHTIEHIESTTPEDIARFGPLGVIPSVQPDHMPKYNFPGHPFHTMIGAERMRYSWPFKSLLDSAGVLAYGTDFTVAPLLPTRGIWRAVHRTTDDGVPEGGWNPGERLTLEEVLTACTLGSAFATGREQELGTLEVGKLADFAVFEDNFFDIIEDRARMFAQEAVMTVLDGRIVYQR